MAEWFRPLDRFTRRLCKRGHCYILFRQQIRLCLCNFYNVQFLNAKFTFPTFVWNTTWVICGQNKIVVADFFFYLSRKSWNVSVEAKAQMVPAWVQIVIEAHLFCYCGLLGSCFYLEDANLPKHKPFVFEGSSRNWVFACIRKRNLTLEMVRVWFNQSCEYIFHSKTPETHRAELSFP